MEGEVGTDATFLINASRAESFFGPLVLWSFVLCPLSVVSCQLSFVSCQLSVVSWGHLLGLILQCGGAL